jgi:hypothetical protein
MRFFYAHSLGSVRLKFRPGGLFPTGRLIFQFSNASFCELTIWLVGHVWPSVVLLSRVLLCKIPETEYTQTLQCSWFVSAQVGWLARVSSSMMRQFPDWA